MYLGLLDHRLYILLQCRVHSSQHSHSDYRNGWSMNFQLLIPTIWLVFGCVCVHVYMCICVCVCVWGGGGVVGKWEEICVQFFSEFIARWCRWFGCRWFLTQKQSRLLWSCELAVVVAPRSDLDQDAHGYNMKLLIFLGTALCSNQSFTSLRGGHTWCVPGSYNNTKNTEEVDFL